MGEGVDAFFVLSDSQVAVLKVPTEASQAAVSEASSSVFPEDSIFLTQADEGRIIAIGNAAGAGACMALLSDSERRHADELALKTEHIELSMNPVFQELYIDAMTFRKQL